jgi:urea transport system substrate-binding protein
MNNMIRLPLWITGLAVWVMVCFQAKLLTDETTIKVGVLHSLTGTMSFSEKAVRDATLMAIDEINSNGGVLGKQIEAYIADGRSDWPTFAEEAENLIHHKKVSVIFGCWTSASRRTIKPIIEKYNSLLFYPVQYEGLENSPNIIYTGAAPNQQIIPAVEWASTNVGKKFFLVGSDYVFPRTANAIIKDQVAFLKGTILGEEYVPLSGTAFSSIVKKIVETNPSMIFNTLNGDSNIAFFKELRAAGITPSKIPTMSFSIAEQELKTMGPTLFEGDYAAWNYFMSINSSKNVEFVKKFKAKYGQDRVTDDPVEAGYFGVYLWAAAVAKAKSTEVSAVKSALSDVKFEAPEGLVYVDERNRHTWKIVRIGKIRSDGQFTIVWSSERPVRPIPYPFFRTQEQWDKFLNNLYNSWGKQWSNPGPAKGYSEK